MKKMISLIMILNILFVLSAYPVSATNRLMGDVNGDGIVSISDATEFRMRPIFKDILRNWK